MNRSTLVASCIAGGLVLLSGAGAAVALISLQSSEPATAVVGQVQPNLETPSTTLVKIPALKKPKLHAPPRVLNEPAGDTAASFGGDTGSGGSTSGGGGTGSGGSGGGNNGGNTGGGGDDSAGSDDSHESSGATEVDTDSGSKKEVENPNDD